MGADTSLRLLLYLSAYVPPMMDPTTIEASAYELYLWARGFYCGFFSGAIIMLIARLLAERFSQPSKR